MDSVPPELLLNSRPPFVLRTMAEFLTEISTISDVSGRLSIIEDRLRRLEDEMRKIDAFKRELPFCMLLLGDAITVLKEESVRCRKELCEPAYEEFLPVKKRPVGDDDEKDEDDEKVESCIENDCKEKIKWTSSFRLWDGDVDKGCSISNSGATKHGLTLDLRATGHTGFPTRKERQEEPTGLSLSTPGIKNEVEETVLMDSFTSKPNKAASSGGASSARTQLLLLQNSRKQRRCWSPELHRTFVSALDQLGGPQVATPKQIRDLMQVEGLTNDEVKSHLQKYRLHVQRLPGRHNRHSSSLGNNKPIAILDNNMFKHIAQKFESSKQSSSQSGSPQGTLQLAASSRGTSTSRSDSIEEDNRSESQTKP